MSRGWRVWPSWKGWQQGNKVRSCLSNSHCPKGGTKKKKTSQKHTPPPTVAHLNTHKHTLDTDICTQTPLSFNDAMRAWKGNTVGIAWVWKKHFFLLWQTKSAMKRRGELLPFPPLSPQLWLLFFPPLCLLLQCLMQDRCKEHTGQVYYRLNSQVNEEGCCFCQSAAKANYPPKYPQQVDLTQVVCQ